MPPDRPRTPDHRKTIALASLAAFVLIIVAGRITLPAAPQGEADIISLSDRLSYTPVVDTHLSALAGDPGRRWEWQFGRFEPEGAAPWYSHSRSYLGLWVSGVIRDAFAAGEKAPTVGPGTCWYVLSEPENVAACVSDEPCLRSLAIRTTGWRQ